jgi:predicted transcriptional regulator
MENDAGMEKLFFELASESRLSILRELQKENLKMQEIARRLDVTATEAFRQLERLSVAMLVQRQPDGTFSIAQYGKLVLQLSSSLEFISKYRDYFSTHDLLRLPIQFVNRLGELSEASLMTDTVENLNMGGRAFMEAEQYGWGIAEGTVPEQMIPIMNQQFQKGLKFKMLMPEKRLSAALTPPAIAKNFEARGLPELPAIVFLTEKEAGVCFFQVGGKVDYTAFYGKDPAFLTWVKELFLYYWEKGERK